MKTFGGPVLFLDRSDINTDEIIPAKYLTEVEKEALRPHLLEDLRLDGFDPKGPWRGTKRVVVTRANFGCGSSREHAPWALEVNGITCCIAESFARIFRQTMSALIFPINSSSATDSISRESTEIYPISASRLFRHDHKLRVKTCRSTEIFLMGCQQPPAKPENYLGMH